MKISYKELAKRVEDMVLCNNIAIPLATMNDNILLELWSGSEIIENENKDDDDTYKEIYQYYIITKGGADYLKEYTDEIVYYHEKLDLYVWGITHYGTSWDYVHTNITDNRHYD